MRLVLLLQLFKVHIFYFPRLYLGSIKNTSSRTSFWYASGCIFSITRIFKYWSFLRWCFLMNLTSSVTSLLKQFSKVKITCQVFWIKNPKAFFILIFFLLNSCFLRLDNKNSLHDALKNCKLFRAKLKQNSFYPQSHKNRDTKDKNSSKHLK